MPKMTEQRWRSLRVFYEERIEEFYDSLEWYHGRMTPAGLAEKEDKLANAITIFNDLNNHIENIDFLRASGQMDEMEKGLAPVTGDWRVTFEDGKEILI